MSDGIDRLIRGVERGVVWLAGLGAVIVLVQMVWITYGVFVRYGLGKPDRMVTEATALLLFPVAFAGLAFALREDAFPKVTMMTDQLRPGARRFFDILNHLLMLGVGGFFAYAGVSATIRSFNSGVASEILHWPRYMFWAPGAVALVLFTLYTALRLIRLITRPAPSGDL
ncbi:TRAP transporter small permease subunit [Ruegeria pomeroyi]|uniref:TRAP transporter small permease protein n=1 Tax=Ruegeria pomeroyi TaxID=89184 RepID=A0A9Q3WI95_9RHOB|nr:TRAP transporter small permease [Ruegeria pomeroyi]MCE8514116.1 TRAP transporter small permease subunit [Ruegeria pomeroyi]MCE8522097.1 TRAP transporter small permease subunit [Ruegeria pomeroyi]MCE8530806.1 TRAP transporter small permease subunit [Ruegeria pomeroyi]MCE8536840.1 TRAP transporter small permease subunit [Ruegeria pomeroyi]MCE8556863.1 TRAP transporter small permease subunit [Ruegeria pomeroyi]